VDKYREQLLEAMEIVMASTKRGEEGTMFGMLNQLLSQSFIAYLIHISGEESIADVSPVDFALYLSDIANRGKDATE